MISKKKKKFNCSHLLSARLIVDYTLSKAQDTSSQCCKPTFFLLKIYLGSHIRNSLFVSYIYVSPVKTSAGWILLKHPPYVLFVKVTGLFRHIDSLRAQCVFEDFVLWLLVTKNNQFYHFTFLILIRSLIFYWVV